METSGTSPIIAILSAGIGGLALAIGLMRRGVSVKIYESAKEFSTVGAGIGFGPNTLNAMNLIDPRFSEQYDKAATQNEKPEFEHSIFDALYAENGLGEKRGWTRGLVGAPYFTRSSAHRKDLLDIMTGFIPPETVQFAKRAASIKQVEGRTTVTFEGGEVIVADAVVGCDGVKGVTRQAVLGDTAPEQVPPKYCGMYAYRGIVPMENAKKILGKHAGDAKWFMAEGKALVIYPISKGNEENFVFFVKDDRPWD